MAAPSAWWTMDVMDAPTWSEVKDWTELEELLAVSDTRGQRLVAIAVATFKQITGVDLASVPEETVPLVEQAVQGLTELTFFQQSPDVLETLSDFDLIQSFNAGRYSETRRSADEARKARLLVAWPWLSAALWGLLTDDRRAYWEMFFMDAAAIPAFDVTEVDWSGGMDFDNGYWFGA